MILLIATEFPPDAAGGGPAVVRQMLTGFPGEIHWWSVRPGRMRNLPPRKRVLLVRASKGSQKGEGRGSDQVRCGMGNDKECQVSLHDSGAVVRRVVDETDCRDDFSVTSCTSFSPGKMFPNRRLPRLKAWLMENVWAPFAVRSFTNAIKQVHPDCIWVIPHDWSIFPLYKVLVRNEETTRFQVTIQDYPDAHHHGSVWGYQRAARMASMQEELYAKATSRDATSLPMLADLEAKTGAKGAQMLHQGLEEADFSFLEQIAIGNRHSAIVKIAYAGTILVSKEFASFVEQVKQISSLKSEIHDCQFEIHFWGAHSYRQEPWFSGDWMFEHGNLPERELLKALRECDWGFIPMSLNDDDPRYNRFSFPTKFITYLAAGLPVIAMGHLESSVMKMAQNYEVGLSISDSGILPFTFASALADPDAKAKYRPEILRCAREQFDVKKMRQRLWRNLKASPSQNLGADHQSRMR